MKRIDNYEVVKKIGEGGMGEVFKALDTQLDRDVAIKMLRPDLSRKEELVNRFRLEALALAKLSHPNIAALYRFGSFGEQYYMVMEFVTGQTLETIIQRQGKLAWREAIHFAIQVLRGLAHSHQAKVIHRDIKPANIMVSSEKQLKLLDFGIARILQTAHMTKTRHTIGTLEYMSPEQHQGKEVDARSDLYAVGTLLYEMLTGQIPFTGHTDYTIIKAVIENKPTPLLKITDDIPKALEKVTLKALEKKPEDRFTNARSFIEALENCLNLPLKYESQTVVAKPVIQFTFSQFNSATLQPVVHFYRDYPMVLVVILLVLLGYGFIWQSNVISALDINKPDIVEPIVNNDLSNGNQIYEAEVTGPTQVDFEAEYQLGRNIVKQQGANDIQNGINALFNAASGGSVKAEALLGSIYLKGEIVDKKLDEAFKWLSQAATQGDANAQNNLGKLYYEQKNYTQAAIWLQKAADQNHTIAMRSLAILHEFGLGMPANQQQAEALRQQAKTIEQTTTAQQ